MLRTCASQTRLQVNASTGVRSCCPNRARWTRKNEVLQAALDKFTGCQGKDRATLPVTLLAHVALTYAPASARGFARSVKDLLGSGARSVHRTKISKIRDAFAGVVKAAMGPSARAAAGNRHGMPMPGDAVLGPRRRRLCPWVGFPVALSL